MAETSDSSDFRVDGVLVNAITGLGTKRDKSTYYSIQSQAKLSEGELEALYDDALCRRVVDLYAEAALSKRPTIRFGEEAEGHDEMLRKFEDYLETSNCFFYFEEALRLQRLYGGSALFLVCDDGRDPKEPLEVARIREITDIVPLSKREIKPHDYNYLNYRNPELYRISTSKSITESNDLQFLLVHSSRVIRFDGMYLPWKQRINNDGWGASYLGPFYEPWKRYRGACDGLSTMLNEMDLFIHATPGLSNKVAAGKEAQLKARMEANALSRSVYGGMIIDSEEQVSFAARSLGGASELFDRLLDDLVCASSIPKPLLFGMSPAGGLSESGKYEDKVWAATLERYQTHSLNQQLRRYFEIILEMRSGPTEGAVPEQWSVYFPPYFAVSDADKANLRQQIALTDQIYLQAQVLTPMEVRASRFGGTNYEIDTVLHAEEEARLVAKRELQHEAALQGFEGQRQRLANGAGEKVEQESDFEPTGFSQDSEDIIQMNGLSLMAGPSNGVYRVAEVLLPDGQRNDAEPLVLIGKRINDTKIYRGFYQREDGEIEPGPLMMGFYSSRAATRALKEFGEGDVSGLKRLDEADLEHLKVSYDHYDEIEYRGMKFPGFNKPVATPGHDSSSHAVLAKEGDEIKLIRFGQQGVKGSPKTKGESETARNRRKSFMARHAKNIKKGKMSAAWWSARHKW